MKSSQIAGVIERDQWSLATGLNAGRPLIIRFRPELRDVVDLTGYSTLLDVTWWYDEQHTSGMPSAWEAIESQEFENRLCELLEYDCFAVLAAVIVTAGTIRWIFYTSDTDECSRRLRFITQKEQPYPIRMVASSDPAWSFLWDGALAAFRREEVTSLIA